MGWSWGVRELLMEGTWYGHEGIMSGSGGGHGADMRDSRVLCERDMGWTQEFHK